MSEERMPPGESHEPTLDPQHSPVDGFQEPSSMGLKIVLVMFVLIAGEVASDIFTMMEKRPMSDNFLPGRESDQTAGPVRRLILQRTEWPVHPRVGYGNTGLRQYQRHGHTLSEQRRLRERLQLCFDSARNVPPVVEQ